VRPLSSHPNNPVVFSASRYAAVLNGTLALVLAGIWIWMGVQGLFWRADFSAYYTGYRMILDGQGGHLYDLYLQAEYQAQLLPEKPADEGLLPFVFGPQAAVGLSPLALLSRPAAFAVWTVLQLGMCFLAIRFLLRLQNDSGPIVRLLMILTLLAFPPLFVSFQMGQVSLWCLVCQLGFVCALKERRPLAVAAWIVAGTIKPQLMVMPCVVLLGLRRWRELAWLTVLTAASAALTTLVLGPRCWLDFLAVLRFHSRQFGTYGIDPVLMYNVKAVLTTVLGAERGNLINLLTSIAWLASLGLVLWLWRHRTALDAPDWRGRMALTFLVGVLVNPHLYAHDVLGLVLPAVLFHAQLRQGGKQRQATAFAVVAVCAPLLFLIDCWGLNPSPIGIRPFVLLMVGAAVWMAWARIHQGTGKPQAADRGGPLAA
jgi:hypothetical protein